MMVVMALRTSAMQGGGQRSSSIGIGSSGRCGLPLRAAGTPRLPFPPVAASERGRSPSPSPPPLKTLRSTWGVEEFGSPDPAVWDEGLAKIKGEGYIGVEAALDFIPGDREEFAGRVSAAGMELALQVHTCGREDHVASLRECLSAASSMGAVLANSHSGHDSWGVEEARAFLLEAAEAEAKYSVALSHETHRKRILWNPYWALDILRLIEGEPIRITADLSHWVVCCERTFDERYDAGWKETLGRVAQHAALIHARVGYCEGPQVPDPRSPEYTAELEAHEGWWDTIIDSMIERGVQPYLEPEFGPFPYLHTTPPTAPGAAPQPVADLWAVNSFVGDREMGRYRERHGIY